MPILPDDPERRSPADAALGAAIARRIGSLADRPDRLEAFLNGVALDGSLRRTGLPSGLAPFMRLPGPEPERRVRARMAELIVRRVSADGCITREELRGGGFTDAEIGRHFTAAKRIARVVDMAA